MTLIERIYMDYVSAIIRIIRIIRVLILNNQALIEKTLNFVNQIVLL
jgi:hypothetical protein